LHQPVKFVLKRHAAHALHTKAPPAKSFFKFFDFYVQATAANLPHMSSSSAILLQKFCGISISVYNKRRHAAPYRTVRCLALRCFAPPGPMQARLKAVLQ